jgi:hypothetical protein
MHFSGHLLTPGGCGKTGVCRNPVTTALCDFGYRKGCPQSS